MPTETLFRGPAPQTTGGGFKGPMRPSRHVRIWLAVAAVLFLAARLPWLRARTGLSQAEVAALNQ